MVLCSKTRNRALSTHNSSSSINTFAESLLGDNYREVDLTANASINVGDDDLGVPNMNTYSINSNTSTNTLYTFQSDTIGNITNIGNVTLDWNGRRLESISQSGTELISYEYNMDGQRVKKTVDGVTTEYFYNGSILAGQRTGNDEIVFMYDNNGDVFGFEYNGTPYYYVKNAQNDVILIVDENHQPKVIYQYDAWGKIVECLDGTDFGLAGKNPIMYRSYYVDLEMGMCIYYLNSRYYIAEWGRFASADSYVQTGQGMLDKNMFAYCMNNPVNYVDPYGSFSILGACVAVGMLVALIFIPSDANQTPKYEKRAKEKYNKNTVNVYNEKDGTANDNKTNAKFYVANEEKGYVNINVDNSLSITKKYEINAILDVIIESPYYRTEMFGSKSYMRAQWYAHNWCYNIATSSDIGFHIMQIVSGSIDPIGSSETLDIRCVDNVSTTSKVLYTVISWVA